MSNGDANGNDPLDQTGDSRERLIEEIAEHFLEQLGEGKDLLKELVDAHDELQPLLEKRLRIVRSLFWLSDKSSQQEMSSTAENDVDMLTNKSPDPVMDYVLRLNCPNCGVRIQMVDSRNSGEVTCDGCGSTIQIDPNRTRTAFPERLPATIGKFAVTGLLGRGGFGSVFKAIDPDLSRNVAIKVPRQGTFESIQGRSRFVREARHAAKLRHRSIVTVFDVAEEDHLPYIVSEYIEGLTLDDLIGSRRLGFRQSAELVVEIADAVHFAHENGVIHRDIKPSNILLDNCGRPHVADFGLALDIKDDFTLTLDGQVLGTPSYMSPEQAAGESSTIDGRTDVYSLGVVLYRMLSGELPFRGSKRMLMHQVIHDDPKPLIKQNEHVPWELDVITRKAMAKDRNHRYLSAQELSEDLSRWLQNKPILARPESIARRLRKWCARKPAIAGLSFLATTLLVTCTAISMIWAIQKSGLVLQIENNLVEIKDREEEISNRLRQVYLSNARHLIDQEDGFSALPWLVKAVPLESESKPVMRLQIGRILDDYPTLTGLWNGGGKIRSARYSDDGKRIIAVNDQNDVMLFRTDSSETNAEKTFQHDDYVLSAQFDSEFRFVASVVGKSIVIWDVETEMSTAVLDHDAPVIHGSFSPTGEYFGSSSIDGVTKIWNVSDWSLANRLELNGHEIKHAAFMPNSESYLTISVDSKLASSKITLWNFVSGDDVRSFEQPGQVSTFTLDTSGDRFAVADHSGKVTIWNGENSQQVGVLYHGSTVRHLFFADQGETIVTITRHGVTTRWNSKTLVRLDDPILLAAPTIDSRISQDSSLLVSAHSDGRIRVHWLKQQIPVCGGIPAGTSANAVDVRNNGRQFIGGGNDGTIKEWDLANIAPKKGLIVHQGPVVQVRCSPDGERIATASRDKTAKIWMADSAKQLGNPLVHALDVLDCDFSIDGRRVVTASADKKVKVWDGLTTAQIGPDRSHPDPVFRVAFSNDPMVFVSGTSKGNSYVWNTNTRNARQEFVQTKSVWSIAFRGSNGFFATASGDGTVNIQNMNDGSTQARLKHRHPITFCSFDPTGSLIATAGSDGNLSIWSLEDHSNPLQVVPLASHITSCNFNHDGNRLVATDRNGTVHILKASAGEFIDEYLFDLGQYGIMYAEFSSDDRFLLAGGGESQAPNNRPKSGNAYLIDIRTGTLIGPSMRHFGVVYRCRFDADSKNVVTGSLDGSARVWPLRFETMELPLLQNYAQLLAGTSINEIQDSFGLSCADQVALYQSLSSQDPSLQFVTQNEIDNWNQYKSWFMSRFRNTTDGSNQ